MTVDWNINARNVMNVSRATVDDVAEHVSITLRRRFSEVVL